GDPDAVASFGADGNAASDTHAMDIRPCHLNPVGDDDASTDAFANSDTDADAIADAIANGEAGCGPA
ncbi:MAG TPA: hypothetical protein VEX37_07615, partial [Thermomicrobiales bacterium]|nr:hypothetical protein [Thermomicrobiales bacterium]